MKSPYQRFRSWSILPVSSRTWGYGVGVAAVLAALLFKLILDPFVSQQETPFLLFSSAIMLSAWYGGLKPGLVATLMAIAIMNWFFLEPRFKLAIEGSQQMLQVVVFLIEGCFVSALAERLHRSRSLAALREIAARSAQQTAIERLHDVERARAEIAARDRTFQRLVDANVVGAMICEFHGPILEANAALLSMLGYSREDLEAGRLDWRNMTPESYGDVDRRLIADLDERGRFEATEKEFMTSAGAVVPVWVGGTTMPTPGQFVCFVMDLTAQRQAKVELLRAKEAAERSNRARGEFLANVSHELRTPMNAILGMTELALDEELPKPVREYLETTVESARTLLYLLNDLLDFSRIEAGHIELDHEPFSLRGTIDQAAKILSLRAAEKGLELVWSIDRDVPDLVVGDQDRLRQIVLNLAGNAIKFTDAGEVVLEVSKDSAAGRAANLEEVSLHLSVKDTGIGIGLEDQKRIFEPFTQVDSTATRAHGGTGLGLSIVQQLIRRMNGRLELESRLGEGTTFHVRMVMPLAANGRGSTFASRSSNGALRGLEVLIIDDSSTNRGVLGEMLRNWSMSATIVGDGREALRAMRAARNDDRQFDVILIDALMPSMDGMEFVNVATREGLLHGAAILMASAADRHALDPKLRGLPIAGFLNKPVSQSDLLNTLMEVIEDPAVTPSLSGKLKPTYHALRILIAEDAPANQKVVDAILRKRGHDVTLVSNGREAVSRLENEDFDLVLMDVQMPVMDGRQATELIRGLAEPRKASIPIVAMTAHAMRGDRELCLAAGMNGYIAKPLDAHQLIREVERLGKSPDLPRDLMSGAADGTEEPASSENGEATYSSEAMGTMIDLPGSLARMGGDVSLLHDMARFFLEDTPEMMTTLENQRIGDLAARAAHSIKGLAANFGAAPVVELASQLEAAASARAERLDLIAELRSRLDALDVELRQMLSLPPDASAAAAEA
ncbi:MAG: response regulator [Planctomycetaceae bacterium]|nr:response regulator [Planctomycetaceae bacterium]